jgi:hypothetical protein
MSLAEVFHALNQAGVGIVPAGDKLQLRPASAVTSELRDVVLRHKAELLALLSPARGDQDADAKEAAAEREALRWEGALTGQAALAVANQASAELKQIITAGAWDKAAVEALVGQAIDVRDAAARRGDLPARAALSAAADAIDAADARRDLSALRQAVTAYLALFPEATTGPPAALPIPGIPPDAVFLYVDGDGWRWFHVPGAYVREDALDPLVYVEIGPARGDAPAPPPGVRLFYADAAGRPCPPAAAFMWTWENAPRWYYSGATPTRPEGVIIKEDRNDGRASLPLWNG